MMNCEICNKKKAKIEITREINSKQEKIYICEECAKLVGFICNKNPEEYSIAKLLSNIVTFKSPRDRKLQKKACKNCGTQLNEIFDTKNMGCSQCYFQFDEQIEAFLNGKGFSDYIVHKGRIPDNLSFYKNYLFSLNKLKAKLQLAVDHENYELAQKIKSDINTLTENYWFKS